jgi:hypothetical protein
MHPNESAVYSTQFINLRAESAFHRRARVWVSAVLALATLGLGLWTALFTARTVYTTYSPVIYADQWSIIRELKGANGVVSIPLLWAQHNEHRILVGRLAVLADLRFFGARSISLLIEIYLVQLYLVLLFAWMCRYFGQFGVLPLITIAGFLSYCMFSPLQMENFYWGMQITYVFPGLAAAVSFACVIWHSRRMARGKASWISGPLVLAFIAAFLAEGSLAYGVFVWPLIVLLCFSRRFPKPTKVLSGLVGLLATGLYLIGYHTPHRVTNPWSSIQRPLSLAKYVITYFASSWDASLPSFSYWPAVSESMTVLAIAFVLGTGLWLLFVRPPDGDLLRPFLTANAILAIITAVLTSLARLDSGLAQATSSRYQSIALLFWASLAALILTFIPPARSGGSAFVGIQVLLVVLMVGAAGRFSAIEVSAKQHQATLATAYAALAYDSPDLEVLRPLLPPAPEKLPVWYAYARAHNLAPDAMEFLTRRRRILKTVPDWGGYRVVAPANCYGFLDVVRRMTPDRVAAQGWAWDITAKRAPQEVVLGLPSGMLVGVGDVETPRPDVQAANRTVSDLITGWNGEALASKGSPLRAFAVLSDSKSICPLVNEIEAP